MRRVAGLDDVQGVSPETACQGGHIPHWAGRLFVLSAEDHAQDVGHEANGPITKTGRVSRQRYHATKSGAIEALSESVDKHGEPELARAMPRRNPLNLERVVENIGDPPNLLS